MRSPYSSLCALAMAGLASAVAGEEREWVDNAVARSLERPAHVALMTVRNEQGTELAPFTTDGCSGGLSAAWEVVADRFPDFATAHDGRPPWEACCVIHDRAYHDAGGASEAEASYEARLAADVALRTCVQDKSDDREEALMARYDVTPDQIQAAYASIASAMFLAVRFGGAPCSGLPWRWGYGYPSCSVLTGVLD